MAQPVETATDDRHTHKDLGLMMVNVYGFVFHASSMLNSGSRVPIIARSAPVRSAKLLKHPNTQTKKRMLPNVLSPLLRGR